MIFASLVIVPCACAASIFKDGYTLKASRACLARLGTIQPNEKDTLTILPGVVGEVELKERRNHVSVLFHRTASDAKRTRARLASIVKGFNLPVDALLFRKQNVVLSWDYKPTKHERAALEACLRG